MHLRPGHAGFELGDFLVSDYITLLDIDLVNAGEDAAGKQGQQENRYYFLDQVHQERMSFLAGNETVYDTKYGGIIPEALNTPKSEEHYVI